MVKALALYHSQEFGNTAAMAEAVAEGLQDAGCEVDLFNTNEGRFDATQFPQYIAWPLARRTITATSLVELRPLWTITTSMMCVRD